jgi:hypothetical protein
LHTLKFERFGCDPLEENDRRLNLIEQLNQSFHMMTHLAAAQRLLQCFGNCGGLPLNMGTNPGRDIASNHPNVVEAEVFAAVRPTNNGKLHKEITKL